MRSLAMSRAPGLYRFLSPPGPRARLSIFIFHRVLARPDPHLPAEPDARRFESIVAFIARHFNVLSLSDAARRLAESSLPAAAACITFDDGYADNRLVAAPILVRHRVPATFFIATGYIGGGRMWNDTVIEAMRLAPAGSLDWEEFGLGRHDIDGDDSRVSAYNAVLTRLKYHERARRDEIASEIARRAGLPDRDSLMMSKEAIRELRDMGMEIGGHTVTHPILAGLGDRAAAQEIGDDRARLAEWLGEPPAVFAYPNGLPERDFTARDVDLVRRAGYSCAVTTQRGTARAGSDPYRLPRFTPWDRAMPLFALRCAATLLRH